MWGMWFGLMPALYVSFCLGGLAVFWNIYVRHASLADRKNKQYFYRNSGLNHVSLIFHVDTPNNVRKPSVNMG